jgi:hypothetical protein
MSTRDAFGYRAAVSYRIKPGARADWRDHATAALSLDVAVKADAFWKARSAERPAGDEAKALLDTLEALSTARGGLPSILTEVFSLALHHRYRSAVSVLLAEKMRELALQRLADLERRGYIASVAVVSAA